MAEMLINKLVEGCSGKYDQEGFKLLSGGSDYLVPPESDRRKVIEICDRYPIYE